MPARCPVCGGHLRQIGCGTQRVEEQLQNLLPGVGVLRMDADTVSAVNTHEKLFRRFREERIPILLGTQMVAKGLDFENVTLVGRAGRRPLALCVRLSRRGDDVQPDRAGRRAGPAAENWAAGRSCRP